MSYGFHLPSTSQYYVRVVQPAELHFGFVPALFIRILVQQIPNGDRKRRFPDHDLLSFADAARPHNASSTNDATHVAHSLVGSSY